jgi:hypothetical protein
MLKNRTTLGVILLVALSCGAMAQSQQYPQPQIKDSKLGKDNSHAQPPPTVNFPTSQEITDAIAAGIERANEKRETNHPPSPPDYSSWWFNFFLAIFTGLLVVVGGVNCYLIFWTLKATEKAANAAEQAANHIPIVERAYVFATPMPSIKNNMSVIFLRIENFGQTPGFVSEAHGATSSIEPTGVPTYPGSPTFIEAVVQKGTADTFPTHWLSPVTTPHYFADYIRYTDIFKKVHISRVCKRVIPAEGKIGMAGPPAWNDWD